MKVEDWVDGMPNVWRRELELTGAICTHRRRSLLAIVRVTAHGVALMELE